MKRKTWIVLVVLGALAMSATTGWATTMYWRNNRYQLPGFYQSRVLDTILTDHKRDINALLAANQALTARVAALEARMATAETDIAANTTDIAANTADIATNQADIATNAADIATNEAGIASNTAAIATNEADIATNTADIATNEADIATNAAGVTALQARMTTAEGNIGTNAGNIASNTSAISSHVSNTTSAHSFDARYVRDSGENLRILRGTVWADGSISTGSGFTVTKGATGVYTINYATPFFGVASPVVSSTYRSVWAGGSAGSSSCTVNMVDTISGNATDGAFTFVITGRQ